MPKNVTIYIVSQTHSEIAKLKLFLQPVFKCNRTNALLEGHLLLSLFALLVFMALSEHRL